MLPSNKYEEFPWHIIWVILLGIVILVPLCSYLYNPYKDHSQVTEEVFLEECRGKTVSVIHREYKDMSILFTDGSKLKIHSYAHHTAGSHLEIGPEEGK